MPFFVELIPLLEILKHTEKSHRLYLMALEPLLLQAANNEHWPYLTKTTAFTFKDSPDAGYHYTAHPFQRIFKVPGHVMFNTHSPSPNASTLGQGLTYRDFSFDKAPWKVNGFHTLCSISENKIILVDSPVSGPVMTQFPDWIGLWNNLYNSQLQEFSRDKILILEPFNLDIITGFDLYTNFIDKFVELLRGYHYSGTQINIFKREHDIFLSRTAFVVKQEKLTPEETFIALDRLLTELPNLKPPYDKAIRRFFSKGMM